MTELAPPPRHTRLRSTWLRVPWPPDALPALLDTVRDPSRSRQASGGIELTSPVALDADDWSTANFVAFLGEAISRQVPVEWRLGSVSGIEPRLLIHLPPPSEAADGDLAAVAEAWRASHGYGRLYYRVGPGFTALKDTRMLGSHARYRIVDPEQVEDFATLVDFAARGWQNPPPAASRALAATLLEERLAVEVRGIAVPLPYRMRIWPIPYTTV